MEDSGTGVGSGSVMDNVVELVDAQTHFAQAEAARLNAVFAYHDAVTSLEALVGASLRFQD